MYDEEIGSKSRSQAGAIKASEMYKLKSAESVGWRQLLKPIIVLRLCSGLCLYWKLAFKTSKKKKTKTKNKNKNKKPFILFRICSRFIASVNSELGLTRLENAVYNFF